MKTKDVQKYTDESGCKEESSTCKHDDDNGEVSSKRKKGCRAQQTTQQAQLRPSSFSVMVALPLLLLRWCLLSTASEGLWPGTPFRISMLARVAVSKTSSTPSIFRAEHSLYARAPMALATLSPFARVTHGQGLSGVSGWSIDGRRSALQPTRITGIVGPQILRTSSFHWGGRTVVSRLTKDGGRD